MDAAGNFAVVWQSDDADGKGIYLQRYDAAGLALGVETLVNTTTTNNQLEPVSGLPAVSKRRAAMPSRSASGAQILRPRCHADYPQEPVRKGRIDALPGLR